MKQKYFKIVIGVFGFAVIVLFTIFGLEASTKKTYSYDEFSIVKQKEDKNTGVASYFVEQGNKFKSETIEVSSDTIKIKDEIFKYTATGNHDDFNVSITCPSGNTYTYQKTSKVKINGPRILRFYVMKSKVLKSKVKKEDKSVESVMQLTVASKLENTISQNKILNFKWGIINLLIGIIFSLVLTKLFYLLQKKYNTKLMFYVSLGILILAFGGYVVCIKGLLRILFSFLF